MKQPATLAPGDTIMLVAPAGPPREERVRLAAKRLEAIGYRVVIPEGFFERTGYLAGDDATRAAELNAAFADPAIDAIFPVTGGFGTTRILHLLDYETIAAKPKVFIGFSDITGLHIAFHQHAGLATFHSPNPQWGLGSDDGLHPLAERYFWRALTGPNPDQSDNRPGYLIDPARDNADAETKPRTVAGGRATGPIVGGNLAVLVALMGTPHELDTAGKILFVEDVNESPYRVDRMLRTLKSAGKLDDAAGVLLGRFTKSKIDENDGVTVDDVFDDYFRDAPYPVLAHFPAGHVRDNVTLPFGVPAELDADAQTLRILDEPTDQPR
ncbi:MAG: LD-carboxypeptidase [Planctomycetota bacterium]